MNPPLVVAIAGPTAAGKSAFAMALCARIAVGGMPWPRAEIVTVDSAQVYRGMDIGTAKPDAAARAAVPHHLLDRVDPSEPYSAARFVDDARTVIGEIQSRGVLPLLVGGTMLYHRALLDGLSKLPGADADWRRQLEGEAVEQGWPALHARLAEVDPATAARLHPNDAQRIGRALEVQALTGIALSTWHAQPKSAALPGRVLRIAVMPQDRTGLAARIGMRLKGMVVDGFLDEVRMLHARGDLHPGLPSIRAVGYRQLWACLDGEYDIEEAMRRSVFASRQLAKRQFTWLRGDARWKAVDATEPRDLERVLNEACAMQQT